LASQLRRGGAPPNHWASAWVDIQLGLAEIGLDRIAEAQRNLGRALVIGGQYDHPLTGVALLEQGRLMMQSGQLPAAARLFEEASYAAYYFDDLGVVEEALALGLEAHVLSGANGVYKPLEIAAAWAQRKNWRQIQAHMLLLLAESLAASGQSESAETLLKTEVPRVLSRRSLPRGRLLAKYRYLTALVAYQMDQPQVAADALQEAIAFQTASSLWNFHIALADQMFDARRLTGKTAREVYATLLADPQASDWAVRPMESLGALSLSHSESFDRWFLATLDQREAESALAVADLSHRRRFLSSLPLGGRLLGLSHILEAPEAALPQAALLQRQDLLVRVPQYQDLLRDSARVRRALAQGPLVPVDDAARKEQAQQLAELGQKSRTREILLRRVALSRQASDILFPPALKAPELQAALEPGEVLILYHQLQGRVYGFAITRSQYTSWQVGPLNRVQTAVAALLREMGNVDPNREIDPKLLLDDKWRKHAAELHALLLGEAQLDLAKTSELIIIPDHVLWYMPFESLLENADPATEPLIDRVPLRYCPLAGLAVGDVRPLRRVARTAVAVGKMFPRSEDDVAPAAYDELAQAVPTAEKLTDPLTGPGPLVASLADELIVLSEIEPAAAGNPYRWSPLPVGRSSGGDSLADWLLLPADGPQKVILPAFHSPAEDALRGMARSQRPGDDLFAATCGLMAAGAKTVLISRWRTGGKTAFDFVREFAQELPHASATEAWQRSILLTRTSTLDVAAEPRINRIEGVDAPPTASHPFFWAGYMLADTGGGVKGADQPAPPAGGAANDAP
jgi:hypothetical protein